MRVLDLFSGTDSSTQAFADAGHEVVTIELDLQFNPTYRVDILDLKPSSLEVAGEWDFIWASPPCTTFSVASIGTHWGGDAKVKWPKTQQAIDAMELVRHTRWLIEELDPTYYVIENPRGILRKLDLLGPPTTVWYCQYGDERAKPTDLYGHLPPTFEPLTCKNGNTACHHAPAPRGARTGTQGRKGAAARSMVPYELSLAMLNAVKRGEV